MKRVVRIGIAIICMVALVVGYYSYLSHRNASNTVDEDVELSEVQSILIKDFDTDYPATPRAVVKWYNRIITAFYAEDYTDEEFQEMAGQARKLLDDDLLELNPLDSYLVSLTAEVEDYKNRSEIIVSSTVCDSKDVQYDTVNGYECAYVTTNYFVREGSTYTRTYEKYCLRKNSNGQWKILTWKVTQKDDTDGF